jgi:hypothetical protein
MKQNETIVLTSRPHRKQKQKALSFPLKALVF